MRIVLHALALIIASGIDGDQLLPAAETEHWALAAWRLCLAGGVLYGVGRLPWCWRQMAADCRYTRVPRRCGRHLSG